MIHPGICSLTLAKQSPQDVLKTAVEAGLQGIEWWGRDHVPHGDLEVARRVGDLTRAAGIEVASYGSYYRAGVSEADGLAFVRVLDTAEALGAPLIRIWAGNQNGIEAGAAHIQAVVDDTLRIADLAAKRDVALTFEFHGGTLTDCNETAVRFAAQVPHPNVWFSWQPPHGYSLEHCLDGLESLLPRLGTLHVFHWTMGSYEANTVNETMRPPLPGDFHRHPLADGVDRWRRYLAAAGTTGRDHWALLEFVRDDCPEQVVADAATLIRLIFSLTTVPA